jgi:hypothetical protein
MAGTAGVSKSRSSQSNEGRASQKRAQPKQPKPTSTRTGPQGPDLRTQSFQSPTIAAATPFPPMDTFKLAPQMRKISGGPIHSSFDKPQPFNVLNDRVQSRTQLLAHAEQAQDLGMYAIQRGQQVPAPSPGGKSTIASPAAPQPPMTGHQGHAVNQAGFQSHDIQRSMRMPPMDMYNNPYGAMLPPNLPTNGQQQYQVTPAYDGLPGPQDLGGQTPKLPGYLQNVPFQQGQSAGMVPNGVANMAFHGNMGIDYRQPFEHHQQPGMPLPAYSHHMQYQGLPINYGATALYSTNAPFSSHMFSGQVPNTLHNGQQRTAPSSMPRSASRMSSIDPQLVSASQYMPTPVVDQQGFMYATRPPTRNGVTATPQQSHAPQFMGQQSQNGATATPRISHTNRTTTPATRNEASAASQLNPGPRMMAPMAQQSQNGATVTPKVGGPGNMAGQKARNGVSTTPQPIHTPQPMAPVVHQSQNGAVVAPGARNPGNMTTQEPHRAPDPAIPPNATDQQPQNRPTATPQIHLPGKSTISNGPTKTTEMNNISQAVPQYTANGASAAHQANSIQNANVLTPHNGSVATPRDNSPVNMDSQNPHNGTTSQSNPPEYPTQPAFKKVTIIMTRPVFDTPFTFPTSGEGWNVVFKHQEEKMGVGQGEDFYARVSKGNFDIIIKNPIFRQGVVWEEASIVSSAPTNEMKSSAPVSTTAQDVVSQQSVGLGVSEDPSPSVLPTQVATPSTSNDTPVAEPAQCSPNQNLKTPKMTASPPLSNQATPADSHLSATELTVPSTSSEAPVVEEAQNKTKQGQKPSQMTAPPALTNPKTPVMSPLSPTETESASIPAPEISVPRPSLEPERPTVSPPSPQLLKSHFRKTWVRDPWKGTGPEMRTLTPYLLEMKAKLAAGQDISSSSPQKRAAPTIEQGVSPSKRQRTSSHTSLTTSPQNPSTMNAQNMSAAQHTSTSNPKKRAAPTIEQEVSSSKRQKPSAHNSLASSPQNPSTMSVDNKSDAQHVSTMQNSSKTSSIESHKPSTVCYANGQAEFTSLSHTSRPDFEEFLKQLPTASPSLTLPSDPSRPRHGSQNSSSSQILQPKPSRSLTKASSTLLSQELKLRQYSADVARQQQVQGPILHGHASVSSTSEGASAGMLLDMQELLEIPDGLPAQEASQQQQVQSDSTMANSHQHQDYLHPAALLDRPAPDAGEVQEDDFGAADAAEPLESWGSAELDELVNKQPYWGQIKIDNVEPASTAPTLKFSEVKRKGLPRSSSPLRVKSEWLEHDINEIYS